MKKLLSIIMVMAMCLGMIGCSSGGSSSNVTATPASSVTSVENAGNSDSNSTTDQNADNSSTDDNATPDNSTEGATIEEDDTETAQGSSEVEVIPDSDNNESSTHIVVDHAGNEVEVPNEINRIVIADTYPMASVLAVFFDSADKIVGMAGPCMTAAKNGLLGELYPEILNAKTDFIDGANVNIEELMKLEPDIVFYSAGSKEEGELYKNAGIAAIAIAPGKWGFNAIETLDNWIALLDEIFVSDGNERAAIVSEYSNNVYELVQSRVTNIPEEERLNIFFLFQYTDTNIMTSGKKFFGQWWCEAIGANNVGEELADAGSTSVNMEQIYSWNPALIFITNFNSATPDDIYNSTVGSYDWSEIDAVLNNQVYKMPLGMYRSYTCGVDTPVTLLWLAKTAYPSYFEDIDITEEAIKYYQTVFGITLTTEQAEKIFNPSTNAGSGFNGQGK